MKRLLVITALLAAPALARAEVVRYCPECGDKAPGEPYEIPAGGIDDPAHTYLRTSKDRFENVALLAGSPAPGVVPSLAVTDETENGVLITPSNVPVSPRPASQAAPPAHVVTQYSTTIVQPVPWLVIAGAGGAAGFMLGVSVTLLVVGRRRRAMEPRASKLVA